MKKTLVINLIGGPGCGKSTTAAGIFYELKKNGVDCEMSLEFAKDKVWENSLQTLDDQIYVFGKQFHKLWRLNGKVDVVITDSPLLLSSYYNKEESNYFDDFVVEQYNRFDNLLFFIERTEQYQENGRIQTEEESKEIDYVLKNIMDARGITYETVKCDNAVSEITNKILTEIFG
jgi:ABC-type dipeptide/oligopeptide/nickel transport system ATPase component